MAVWDQILLLVHDANPERCTDNLHRRTIKLLEELGEVAEAWLSVTSVSNGKQKTWDDVREEMADCLIVALDIAWTPMPGEQEPRFVVTAAREVIAFDCYRMYGICQQVAMFGQSLGSVFVNLSHEPRRAINRVVDLVSGMVNYALPDQHDITIEALEAQLLTEVQRKLAKWAAHRAQDIVTEKSLP